MAGITISDIAQTLKRVYDPVIHEQRNRQVGIYKRFEPLENFRGGEGAGFYFAIRLRGNRKALGARAESSATPTASYITDYQGYVTTKYNYRTFQITGPAFARASKLGSFVPDLLADDIEDGVKDLNKDLNRQAWRAGDGLITTCVGDGSSATSLIVASARHLEAGDYIEVYTTAGVAEIAAATISNIDYTTKTLTIDTSSSWSDGSYLYRDGQYNSGTPLEMMGLQGMVSASTSTFQGISPSTYLEWRSYVDIDGGTITREALFKAIDYTELLYNEPVTEIWCTPAMRSKVFLLLQPSITFERPTGELELAYNTSDDPLQFEGKKFLVDNDCPGTELYGLNWNSFGKIETKEVGIGSVVEGDSTIQRVSGYDYYEGHISTYQNLVCTARRANFKLTGLTQLYEV